MLRRRIATPPAQKKPQKLTSAASVYSPTRSTAPPPMSIPTANAIAVSMIATSTQRTNAASA
jgi:hypothetical protein